MPDWCDAHNHLHDPRLGGDATGLLAAMKSVGVTRVVVNATREDDWSAVARLASARPDIVRPAFGIHPWHAGSARPGWEQRLAAMLEAHPHASVGECGLDGWIGSTSIEVQLPVFLAQLRLAAESRRPLTIHCLKAWGPFLSVVESERFPKRFLMHAFGGSLEVARRLIGIGAGFSFSGHFLHPRKAATLAVFRHLPIHAIFVETDAPDMAPPCDWRTHPLPDSMNHPANLPAIGRGLAMALGIGEEALAAATCANWHRMFG